MPREFALGRLCLQRAGGAIGNGAGKGAYALWQSGPSTEILSEAPRLLMPGSCLPAEAVECGPSGVSPDLGADVLAGQDPGPQGPPREPRTPLG